VEEERVGVGALTPRANKVGVCPANLSTGDSPSPLCETIGERGGMCVASNLALMVIRVTSSAGVRDAQTRSMSKSTSVPLTTFTGNTMQST
jgi:hypothetical protein